MTCERAEFHDKIYFKTDIIKSGFKVNFKVSKLYKGLVFANPL